MVTSAMTETGLNTVNPSDINTFQQVLLFLLMIGGSSIFVSNFVVLVRKRAFESRFSELVGFYEADKKDNNQGLRNGLDGILAPSPHLQEQCRSFLFFPDKETRPSSSAITPPNPFPGNERGCSTTDRLQAGAMRLPSLQHRATASVRKDSITSHLRAPQATAEHEAPRSLTGGSDEENLGSTSAKNQPLVLTGLVATLCHRSGASEGETLDGRHEPEECDANSWAKGHRVDRHIALEHNDHEVASFSLPVDDLMSKAISNSGSRINREDRMQLGGAEYGAIKLLTYLIPTYFVTWQLIGCLSAVFDIVSRCESIAESNATNPWYVIELTF